MRYMEILGPGIIYQRQGMGIYHFLAPSSPQRIRSLHFCLASCSLFDSRLGSQILWSVAQGNSGGQESLRSCASRSFYADSLNGWAHFTSQNILTSSSGMFQSGTRKERLLLSKYQAMRCMSLELLVTLALRDASVREGNQHTGTRRRILMGFQILALGGLGFGANSPSPSVILPDVLFSSGILLV